MVKHDPRGQGTPNEFPLASLACGPKITHGQIGSWPKVWHSLAPSVNHFCGCGLLGLTLFEEFKGNHKARTISDASIDVSGGFLSHCF